MGDFKRFVNYRIIWQVYSRIICHSLGPITRQIQTPHLIRFNRYLFPLSAQGVGFISLTDGIDTTVAAGKLLFHIIGALAEFERQLISERTKAGMQAAKLRGVHVGRPRLLNNEHRELAVSLLSSGYTRKSIAKQMGVSINTLCRHLNSDTLIQRQIGC